MLSIGQCGFDGVDDAQARDHVAARSPHGLRGEFGAAGFDDVALRRGRLGRFDRGSSGFGFSRDRR